MVTLEQCRSWPCTLCSPLSRTGEVACVKFEIYTQNLAAVKEFPTNNASLWISFDINIGNIQHIMAAFTIVVTVGRRCLLCPCINHTVTLVHSWINAMYPLWPPDAWYFCKGEIKKTVFFSFTQRTAGATEMQIFTRRLERQSQCLVKPKKEWKMCMFTCKSRIRQLLSVDT